MKISVCIPCYNRPFFAKEAIISALNQDPKPYEILIGDDSDDAETEYMVNNIDSKGVPILYIRNRPSLGQGKNVNELFKKASGDIISLIHDDDRYRPNAFNLLIKPFIENPNIIATFGKQMIISELGVEDLEASKTLNESFNRNCREAGLVETPFEAGAIAMFPNNGYFVKSEIAKSLDYNDDGIAGKGCDYYFGFRLGIKSMPFYFIDKYTCDYRLTSVSSHRNGTNSGYYSFKILTENLQKEEITLLIKKTLERKVKVAILQSININRRQGIKWYFSPWHRKSIFTLGGIRRLLFLIFKSRL